MRGRATGVALPALVALALVAVVALAATGGTPAGSDASRAPHGTAIESLLDTLFTLGLAAVVAGGVLVLYGLTQRKAIAEELASGRYRRAAYYAFLAAAVLVAGFYYVIAGRLTPPQRTPADEPVFGGNPIVPTTTEQKPLVDYEPGVSWLSLAVVAVVIAGVVAFVVADRRSRRGPGHDDELGEQLAVVLDDALEDLRGEADPRRAIIAAYARLERVLAANGIARRPSETSEEYLARVRSELTPESDAIVRLTGLFEQAKFSHHDVDTTMKEDAISALEQARDELRLAAERGPGAVTEVEPTAAEVPA